MNKYEFIENAKKYLNYHYLYGYKGEIITEALNNTLSKEYPKIWNQNNYKTKSRAWIGDRALDCSGLVCRSLGWKIGKDVGSYYMGENWEATASPSAGLVAWKSGHVAICIDNKTIIEAAGIEAGVRIREFKKSEFKKYLKAPEVDYSKEANKYKIGWNKDEHGWRYSPDGIDCYKRGYFKLPWSGGVNSFYFDFNGYCIITDANGVIKEPRG